MRENNNRRFRRNNSGGNRFRRNSDDGNVYRNNTSGNNYDNSSLKPKGGLDITGKNDMIFVRNNHQAILDQDFSDIMKRMWDLEDRRKFIIQTKNECDKLRRNIEKHMEERDRSYSNIQNLLKKEEDYEEGMLDKTLDGMKLEGNINIKQKFKDVDIDSLQHGTVEQYKRLYPKFGEEIFKNIEIFNKKEKEIRNAQEEFHQAVSDYNSALEIIDVDIQKAEDNFSKYNDDFDTAEKELKDCRYYKSIAYKFASKKTKMLLNINTSRHDVRKFSNDLDVVTKSISGLSPINID
tara:strand:- start:50 stop:928 length:879 start_codon:yes stop_codon:yes gene_type:complete